MKPLDYYNKNYEKIFSSIINPQWRIWKVVRDDGIVVQSRIQITKPERLIRFINSCGSCKALYVSITEFLNPHKNHGFFWNQRNKNHSRYFYPRAGYLISECIPLTSYFFIDLDSEEDLRIAQSDGRKIIKYLEKKQGLSLDILQFSGTKGIHLGYTMPILPHPNPITRTQQMKGVKTALAKELLDLDLKTINKVHMDIMCDVFRVYAAPSSIKSSGNVVTSIARDDFMDKDIYRIMAIEGKPDESKVATCEGKTLQLQQHSVVERDGLSSTTTFSYRYIDNKVWGIKDKYVTAIKKHKDRFSPLQLRNLQKLYNLSDFYIFEVGNYIYSYCFKVSDFIRTFKILRKAKSENLHFFMTRRHIPIQTTDSKLEDGTTYQKVKFLGKIESSLGHDHDHSFPHCDLFGLSYPHLVGGTDNHYATFSLTKEVTI